MINGAVKASDTAAKAPRHGPRRRSEKQERRLRRLGQQGGGGDNLSGAWAISAD
jgi:hypothetical protein